jgi:non-heme chloroperoxidase
MNGVETAKASVKMGMGFDDTASIGLPTGVVLPYAEQGDDSGVPVVFVHGYSDSWRSWEPVLPYLPESIHAFVPTQRGHGDAGRPLAGYRPEDFATDLAAFIDGLAIGRAVIVGHSLGSYVAQRFAMDRPENVLGLVLVGTATTWRGNPVVAELWESVISTLDDPVDPAFVREFQASPRLTTERLETMVQESLKMPARIWRDVFAGILEADFSAELSKIKAPALIVWGDQDSLCSEGEQEALVSTISNSRLRIYRSSGHNLHWEEPERFAADVVSFISDIAG